MYRNLYSILTAHIISERGTEIPWVLKKLRHEGKKQKILVLGICESLFTVYLATIFDDVYGVDIRKYMGIHPNLNHGDISSPFPAGLRLPEAENSAI